MFVPPARMKVLELLHHLDAGAAASGMADGGVGAGRSTE